MADPWRLINMKVKHEIIARIDAEARRLGLSRSAYMVMSSDPERRKELVALVNKANLAEIRAS